MGVLRNSAAKTERKRLSSSQRFPPRASRLCPHSEPTLSASCLLRLFHGVCLGYQGFSDLLCPGALYFSLSCRSLHLQRHSLCTFCRWQSSSKTKPKHNSTSFLRGAIHSTVTWVPDSISKGKEALDQNPSPCTLTMATMWAASCSWNLAFQLGMDWMSPQPVSLVVCHSSDTRKVHTWQRPSQVAWTLEY